MHLAALNLLGLQSLPELSIYPLPIPAYTAVTCLSPLNLGVYGEGGVDKTICHQRCEMLRVLDLLLTPFLFLQAGQSQRTPYRGL